MEVIFYKFAKRVNSTKRPSGGVVKNVSWKEKTDLHRPTVKCQSTEAGKYNYMKIGDHYYWIVSEVVMPNAWIEWTGEVDPLATCADEVKATTAFVERSNVGSTSLLDSLAPARSDDTPQEIGSADTGIFSSGRGSYIVSLANYPLPLVMNFSEFNTLYEQLNSESVINQLENSIVRLSEVITGAIWLPIDTIFSQGTLELKAGFVTTGIVGNIVDNAPIVATSGMGMNAGSSILESSAYSELYLYLPFVGAVQLSPDQFKGYGVSVETSVDPTNGSLLYKVMNGNGVIVATYSGSCGVPIPVGSTSYNVGGAISTALGIAGSVATGNVLGAAMMGSALMFSGLKSVSAIGGGGGSRAGLSRLSMSLYRISKSPPEALTTKRSVVGLPTYRTITLGTLTGFVKCINASIEAAQEQEVIEACNNFLNTGAYIE